MSSPVRPVPPRQRGVVLIFTLIVLLILTIGAVALMRSMNTSLVGAGNLAFRRDLVNQGEQAVSNMMTTFQTGALSASASTYIDVPGSNYSATMLVANPQGVPNILFNTDAAFAAAWTAPDIAGPTPDIAIRYVVDRLCSAAGPPSSALCVQSTAAPTGGTANQGVVLAPPTSTVYRLTVRVTGARSTQIFLQTTFTRPD